MSSGAPRILAQAEKVETQRIAMLRHLERDEIGHRLGRRAVHESVARLRSAVAAGIREHADEEIPAVGMTSAHRAYADRAKRRCGCAVRDRLSQRAEHDGDDAAQYFQIA